MSAPALVILAAGASRRLGTCKALADLGGTTPLGELAREGRCIGPLAPLVVVGAHASEIAAALPEGCELASNPDWEGGRLGSVRVAIRARPGLDLCLAPVDVPLVPRRVFEQLAAAWSAAGAPAEGWLAPCVRHGAARAHGHPIVIGRELANTILRTENALSLKEFRAGARALLEVEVDSPAILDDLDTPADLAKMRQRRGF